MVESTLKNARFKVDNEFSGADASAAGRQARSDPVEFDKADVFGLDEFMQVSKKTFSRNFLMCALFALSLLLALSCLSRLFLFLCSSCSFSPAALSCLRCSLSLLFWRALSRALSTPSLFTVFFLLSCSLLSLYCLLPHFLSALFSLVALFLALLALFFLSLPRSLRL